MPFPLQPFWERGKHIFVFSANQTQGLPHAIMLNRKKNTFTKNENHALQKYKKKQTSGVYSPRAPTVTNKKNPQTNIFFYLFQDRKCFHSLNGFALICCLACVKEYSAALMMLRSFPLVQQMPQITLRWHPYSIYGSSLGHNNACAQSTRSVFATEQLPFTDGG